MGHWLGLDVHDVGGYEKGGKLRSYKNGMITTIEPGIYIPNKFGVRLEEIVILGENGPEILSKIPRDLKVIDY